MRVLHYFFSIFVSLVLISQLYSQEFAITESGKRVLLKKDKTWEYVQEKKAKNTNSNFRKTRWGMSIQQVKNIENLKIAQEDSKALIYNGKVANLESYIMYIFTNDKLVRSKYFILESHTNKNDYIYDYKKLKEILLKKYGTAKSDEQLWLNNLYKNDYDDWGMAISIGHMRYYAEWSTSESDILLALYGDNYKISLVVEYTSKRLKNLEQKAKEEQTLNDF